mmetsp:Transcript_679/g.2379  ORF Transcript_679/g.2379 Transcript_679/m.2379 type:complete len:528 (-) Transcript_679:154-1737(-)
MSTDLLDGQHHPLGGDSSSNSAAQHPPPQHYGGQGFAPSGPSASTESSPSYGRGHAGPPLMQQQQPTRQTAAQKWQLQFKVRRAHLGSGTLRQITYFPLEVTPSPVPPNADTPTAWETTATFVYRRYSEVVKLRRYLVLKYPGELIPALPAKSVTDTFNTAMCDGSTLDQQERMLRFFFDILSGKPRIYAYDPHFAAFMQLPRDSKDLPPEGPPETRPQNKARQYASFDATMSSIEQEIARFEQVLDRTDPSVFASSATAAMGGFMRSTAKTFSSWWSKGDNEQYQVTESAIMERVKSETGYCEWSKLCDKFRGTAMALQEAHAASVRAQAEHAELRAAGKDVTNALSAFADAMSEEVDAELRSVVGGTAQLSQLSDAATERSTAAMKMATAMLFSEVLCVQGIIEAIQLLMNRYRHLVARELNRMDKISAAERTQLRAAIANVSGELDRNIKSWVSGVRARIVELGAARARNVSAKLAEVGNGIRDHNVHRFMLSEQYLEGTDPTVPARRRDGATGSRHADQTHGR